MDILSTWDFVAGTIIVVLALCFGAAANFSWISTRALTAFLAYKLLICIAHNLNAVLTGDTYDAIGYFMHGQDYARMINELIRGDSIEYLQNTPFFGIDGTNTERFTSLAGLLVVLTGSSFIGCNMLLGLVGAVGQLLIFRYLRQRFPHADHRFFYLILFHPSLTLWSSSMVKDSVGIFSLGVAVYYVDVCLARFRLSALAAVVGGLYAALLFRPYILLEMAIFFLFAYWDRIVDNPTRRSPDGWFFRFAYIGTAGLISAFALVYTVRNYGSEFSEKQQYMDEGYSYIEAGSSFQNATLSMSAGGLAALPIGAVNALLRPFLWEARKANQLLAALENLYVAWFVWRAWRIYTLRLTSERRRDVRSLLWGGALIAAICGSGIGLFSSNLGTISRYRIPIIPMMLAGPCVVMGLHSTTRRPRPAPPGMPQTGGPAGEARSQPMPPGRPVPRRVIASRSIRRDG